MQPSSINIYPVEGYHNAYWAVWEHKISPDDIHTSFRRITEILDNAVRLTYFLIDIRRGPQVPIRDTLVEAYNGPFTHKMLGSWLFIGSMPIMRVISSTLANTTRRHNVQWFDTPGQALNYLATVSAPTYSQE